SRRRHTRSKRDWSSDVCSSDLTPPNDAPESALRVEGFICRRPPSLSSVGNQNARFRLLLRVTGRDNILHSCLSSPLMFPGRDSEIGRASCRASGESRGGAGL